MRTPINWMGGKGNMVGKLKRLIPAEYNYYVEPFFGGGSLFFALPPAKVETINDLDSNVMDFYRVLRDAGSFEAFKVLAEYTPNSRELWEECRDTWVDEEDKVTRAWKWWVLARMSFGGLHGASFGTAVTHTRRGMSGCSSKLLSAIEALPEVHERLKRAQIENCDGVTIVERYAVEGAFCYCDPPYVASTRVSGEYSNEMTDKQHEALIEAMLSSPAKFMVSGYDHPIYHRLDEEGWQRKEFETACHVAARTRSSGIQGEGAAMESSARTEVVWRNYEGVDAVGVDTPKAVKVETTRFEF